MAQHRWRAELVGIAVLTVIVGAVMFNFRLDDSFISYRYARNIAQGFGFVYNVGEPVLSITNPLYTLLLALGYPLIPNLHILGNLLGVIAIGLGALVMMALARPLGWPARWGTGLFYVGFPLIWLALGLETPLQILLGVLATWLYTRERPIPAAVVLGLGTLTRPDMLVLVAVLAADWLLTKKQVPMAAAGTYVAVLLPWVLWASAYFGSPLPVTLATKGAQTALGITGFRPDTTFAGGLGLLAAALVEQTWLWAVVGGVILAGALDLPRERWAQLLLTWGGCHLVGYMVLGVAPYRWYYAPLVPGLAALFGLGVRWIAVRLPKAWRLLSSSAAIAVLAVAAGRSFYLIDQTARQDTSFLDRHGVVMLPTVDWDIYRETGTWLRYNTPTSAQVGVAEVGQLGYWAERPMIDYLGLLQPEVAQALARRDIYWWLPHTMPEYLVLSGAEGAALYGHSLEGDAWFQATYTEVARFDDERYLRSPMVIYQRLDTPRDITEAAIGLQEFSHGITLNRAMTDFSLRSMEPGQAVRVQLEWYLADKVETPQHIVVRLLSRDGVLAGQTDRQFDLSTWPTRRLTTTYHTFELAPALVPGVYDMAIGVGPHSDALVWQTVAQAKVPLQEEAFIGGLSGARESLGEVALTGYRLARSPEGLEVMLVWEAIAAPHTDYCVFIHVRDGEGQIATQADSEPRDGTYPTSIWDAGEVVPDVYRLATDELLPGDYEVYAGLYRQDGSRLRTPDGRDSIWLGRIAITEHSD